MNASPSQHDQLILAEAAILAGGVSRRMGRDKAWLKLGDRSLIEILVALSTSIFQRVRIIADEEEKYRKLNVPVQPDIRPGSGPLGGIHSALATAQHSTLFVMGCDFPFLNSIFIKGLAESLGSHDAAVPRYPDRPVPVCAFYSVRCLSAIEASLNRGIVKAASFLKDVDVRWMEGEELMRLDPDGLALMNLNTPQDYSRALEIIEDQGYSFGGR